MSGVSREHLLCSSVIKCYMQRVMVKQSQTMARTDEVEWKDIRVFILFEAHTERSGMQIHMKVSCEALSTRFIPILRTLRVQEGLAGGRNVGLIPVFVSPGLPFWAIILICLAVLLILITCLMCCFLVSKEVCVWEGVCILNTELLRTFKQTSTLQQFIGLGWS